MEILQLLWSHHCPLANTSQLIIPINYSAISSQPPLQNSTELITPTVLVITSQHGPHRKHRFSVVVFMSIAVGMCLPQTFAQKMVV
jgi:hypothetical protein